MKQSIKQYNETNKVQYARDVATLYEKNLHPLLIKIRNLKYKENTVFFDEDNNTCNLLQNKYKISSMEYSSYTSKVSSYDVGLQFKQKKRGADKMKEGEKEREGLNQPMSIITAQPMPTGEVPRDEPIYGQGKDGIAWNNPEYQKLWDSLPLKLKNVLRPNREWMIDFMYNCLNDRLKPGFAGCKLPAPKDLKIPPEKGANGLYDFGVKIYNDVFNKLSSTLQDTYLTMYKEADGVKNYDMFTNAVTDAVAKEVDLDRGFF